MSESMHNKWKSGKITRKEYRNWWVQNKGFKNEHEYYNFLAQQNGFENRKEYKKQQRKNRPIENKKERKAVSNECRKNMSLVTIKKWKEPEYRENHRKARIGTKHSSESREKQKQSALKRFENQSERDKISKAGIKRFQDPKERQKMSRPKSKEEIEKIRIAAIKQFQDPKQREIKRKSLIKRIEENYGIAVPFYNITACEYFKFFDLEYNTKGRYALYGNGEYCIEELGYFPDYINFDLKLIMEWDEEYHYTNGILSERDNTRQQEIQKLYPDFEFIRIREKDILKTEQ